jgi:hypothetical protein
MNERGSRQTPAIPQQRGGSIGDDLRAALARHRARFELADVTRQQRESMRIVSQQVAFDECARNVIRVSAFESRVA